MIPIPPALGKPLAGREWQSITIGESIASVYRLIAPGQPDLILKLQTRDSLRNLKGEVERMRWLSGKIEVPEIIDFIQDEKDDWLLMTALPGGDATTSKLPPRDQIKLLADNLRRLHSLDVTDCPFQYSNDRCIAEAATFLEAGRVNTDDFDSENLGRDPTDLYAELLATKPTQEEIVFTHGDCCWPNFILDGECFSGFIDLGCAGISDPYRDFALIERSIPTNLGPDWSDTFFERYGLSNPDQARLRFFRLLDEFL